MKKIAVLMALTSIVAVGGVQAESPKDECLLYSEKCANQAATLQQRVKKLQQEIKKGKIYNPQELKKLEMKLKEANDLLNSLKSEAPSAPITK